MGAVALDPAVAACYARCIAAGQFDELTLLTEISEQSIEQVSARTDAPGFRQALAVKPAAPALAACCHHRFCRPTHSTD